MYITNTGISTRRGTFDIKKDDDEFELKLEVVKKWRKPRNKSRVNKKFVLFSGCSAKKRLRDIDLCTVEILLVVSILVLAIQEFWQCMALGRQYFMELENWFELLILSLAISTLSLKTHLDSLQIVSAVGICLAWIELIFLFGRYPFLGGYSGICHLYLQIFLRRKFQHHVLLHHQKNHKNCFGLFHSHLCFYLCFLHHPFRE